MTVPIVFLFLTDLSVAHHTEPIPYRFNVRDLKGHGRVTNESAILSNIDDRDMFCKGNANAIFPDPYAYNIYYRCRRNRRETWKCIGDLYFDRKTQKCSRSLFELLGASRVTDICHQQEDGLYPLYNTNCRYYVRCKGGKTVDEKQCRANEMFSYYLQSCRIRSEVMCVESFCSQNNDGFFVVPGSKCQAYYLCRRGSKFDFLCPRGQMFDLQTKNCVEGGICYEPICVGRLDGIYADTTHNCERYFRCRGGELLEITSCPESLKHNGFMCVPSDNVKCEKPEKTAVVVYNRRDDECKFLRDGNHIIPGTDCTRIRTCIGGRTIGTSECPLHYRFNGNQCYHKDLTDCDDLCSGNRDGYYADVQKNCREFYYCQGGMVKERRKCENGTFFHDGVCSPSLTDCGMKKTKELFCQGLRDGYHPNYLNNCRDYYLCHNHQVITLSTCPQGMKWNGSQCVDEVEFRCETPRPLPQCMGMLKGVYQDITSNCTNYIYCDGNQGTVLACPKGELFDGYRCRDSREYTCPSMVRDECYNQPDGYKQDMNSNCRSYYFCSKGNKITYICKDNFVFNGTQCVSPKYYTCPYHTNDCTGKFNGYYPDESAGCKKYFYCLHEKRITTLNCGGMKIFDGDACVYVNDVKVGCANAVRNPCHRRKDGKYADRKTQCDGYIECKNQRLMEEIRCPRGTSFDGTTCSYQYSCHSSPGKHTCDGGKSGFVPQYDSGCKNYYFCIGNFKMLATCPEGTIFNGKVCQDMNTYKCPTEGYK